MAGNSNPSNGDPQAEAIAFLAAGGSRGADYGRDGPARPRVEDAGSQVGCSDTAEVQHIVTHASHVFLVDDVALKLERAVHFPFMDLSTLARRRVACAKEFFLNRRFAPELYTALRPVIKDTNTGKVFLGPDVVPSVALQDGPVTSAPSDSAYATDTRLPTDFEAIDWTPPSPEQNVIDWVVQMARFDTRLELCHLVDKPDFELSLLDDLVVRLVQCHNEAPRSVVDWKGEIDWIVKDNVAEIKGFREVGWDVELLRLFEELSLNQLEAQAQLATRRQRDGYVRLVHGDLHCGNIVLSNGRLVPFDCIGFNDRLCKTDVLYDVAFLLMDLEYRGLHEASNRALNTYLQHTGDYSGLALLPLYLSARAAIRAKVAAASHQSALAASYLELATDYLKCNEPVLVCVGGESGCGKSLVARQLAPWTVPNNKCGAIVLRSDVIRKTRAGVALSERLPQSAYTPESRQAVYDELFATAKQLLEAGLPVVCDATFTDEPSRAQARELGAQCAARCVGLWLQCPASVRLARVAKRTRDPSDAGTDLVQRIGDRDHALTGEWRVVDANAAPEEVVARCRRFLNDE
eukprot:m.217908 g.217908  ORF g.217908 m.217908 type:complete len:577 (+) comp18675_c0_seq20:244-1974(+)